MNQYITIDSEEKYFKDKKLNLNFFDTKYKNKIIDIKPQGKGFFWFACGTEWLDLCLERENFYKLVNKKIYQLDIDESKILIIDSIKKVKEFTEKYGSNKIIGFIDWKKVMKEYSGFKCCPYKLDKIIWENEKYIWFRTLDCASGCIWNPNIISNIRYGGIIPKYNFDSKKLRVNIILL